MGIIGRYNYLSRVIKAYLTPSLSQLSFWHGIPEINQIPDLENPLPYYMKFRYKANYKGKFDSKGIPLLNYHGNIGMQYNPIAIAQYGLGNYNLFLENHDIIRKNNFIAVAEWLCDNLVENHYKVPVWMHEFDFEYKELLKSPWYSGLAQGMGISLLLRAYELTKIPKYKEKAKLAYISFEKLINEGGVIYIDEAGFHWIEEYIISKPTHILNGFMWALFGVNDMWKFCDDKHAETLFMRCVNTLEKNLEKYDVGFWSKYELTELNFKMLASPFYHDLHIVQLKIFHKMTNKIFFKSWAERWSNYIKSDLNRFRALFEKSLFKLFYY